MPTLPSTPAPQSTTHTPLSWQIWCSDVRCASGPTARRTHSAWRGRDSSKFDWSMAFVRRCWPSCNHWVCPCIIRRYNHVKSSIATITKPSTRLLSPEAASSSKNLAEATPRTSECTSWTFPCLWSSYARSNAPNIPIGSAEAFTLAGILLPRVQPYPRMRRRSSLSQTHADPKPWSDVHCDLRGGSGGPSWCIFWTKKKPSIT